MHRASHPWVTAWTLLVLAASTASAFDCPVVVEPDPLGEHDRQCLTVLDEKFPDFSPDIPFRSERNALLLVHYNANQQFVIDSFYARYCRLLQETKWGLSDEQRLAKLDTARDELYARVPFPPPVVTSVNLSWIEALPKTYLAGGSEIASSGPSFAWLWAELGPPIDDAPADSADQESGSHTPAVITGYLRDVPFVVTKGNKHFVIVASASSREAAIDEVRRLKEKAPQFDFVAYPPYRGNPYFGVMMATWVPWSVAQAALADAREYVNPDSYIWSCRGEGDTC